MKAYPQGSLWPSGHQGESKRLSGPTPTRSRCSLRSLGAWSARHRPGDRWNGWLYRSPWPVRLRDGRIVVLFVRRQSSSVIGLIVSEDGSGGEGLSCRHAARPWTYLHRLLPYGGRRQQFRGALHIAGNFFRLAWSSPSSMGACGSPGVPKAEIPASGSRAGVPPSVWGLVWPPPNDAAVLRSGPVYDTSSTRMQPHRRTAYPC